MERHYDLSLDLEETMDDTVAVAKLKLWGDDFETSGSARRNPADPAIPAIGEELAIARALAALSARMMEAASEKIGAHIGT